MVRILNTEKPLCHRTVSVPFYPFSRMEMSEPAKSITDLEILLCLQPVFSVEGCSVALTLAFTHGLWNPASQLKGIIYQYLPELGISWVVKQFSCKSFCNTSIFNSVDKWYVRDRTL